MNRKHEHTDTQNVESKKQITLLKVQKQANRRYMIQGKKYE